MSDYELIMLLITGDNCGYCLWGINSAYLSHKRQIALHFH